MPAVLPKYLPRDWKGGFILLAMVWLLSSFLDNIAAALIGGAMAHQIFRGKVHIGFLAAIVAASNAGGSWSVVGDTTTTMMWIAGVSPIQVFHASELPPVSIPDFDKQRNLQQYELRVKRLDVEFETPGTPLARAVARLFGTAGEYAADDDLRRLKQILEAGETATTRGQPQGRRETSHRP